MIGISRVFFRSLLPAVCLICAHVTAASGLDANPAGLLRDKYAGLGRQLANNQFQRPLHLVSTESPDRMTGDIYALVNYPFAVTLEALIDPSHWCDILSLHLNTKYCRASTGPVSQILDVRIGRKYFQQLGDAYPMNLEFHVATRTPEYFDVRLDAKSGPFGASDYLLRLEAVSLQGKNQTFLHLTYAYTYNLAAWLAMQGYLETIGRGKVGFSRAGDPVDGQSGYVDGVRGVVERNVMRYYLAIEAYLGELSAAPAEQYEKRLQRWFAATELYPLQLHEIDRDDYLDMKRREYLRQQLP